MRRLIRVTILFVILTTAVDSQAADGSAFVPYNDPVYGFLDRCSARGFIPITAVFHKPLQRSVVGRWLMDAATRFPELHDRVLEADLKYFLQEFAWDVEKFPDTSASGRRLRTVGFNPGAALAQPHRHLSSFRSDEFQFVFDPVGWFRVDAGSDKTIIRRAAGITFRGDYAGRVGYYFRFVDNTERGNGRYYSRAQLWDDHFGYVGPLTGGKETYYDLTEAHLAFGWRALTFTFGKDVNVWGAGRQTNLLLSANAPSYDQMRMTVKLGDKARYIYVVGKLTPGDVPEDTLYITNDGWVRISTADKWLAAHRLEYSPFPIMSLAVNEAIVWGERGVDWGYLNPINFYYSAGHNGEDRDNLLMSGDFVLRLLSRGFLYGELLIDDLSVNKLGGGYAGNKYSVSGGLWISDLSADGLEMGLEYTRVQPFVYSHFYPVNRFTNWTSGLGTDVKPNSDRWTAEFTYRPIRKIGFDMTVSRNRHGDFGGDIGEPLPRNLQRDVRFLDDGRREWSEMQINASLEVRTGLIIKAGWGKRDPLSIVSESYYMSAGYRF